MSNATIHRRRLLAASTAATASAILLRNARIAPISAQSDQALRIVENAFPASLDANVGFSGYALMSLGIAESLMQCGEQMVISPWLAESLERIDDLTWRVNLRNDARFWDGSQVDAAAVIGSFERAFETNAGPTRALLPEGTILTGTGSSLDISTPTPIGRMDSLLAAFYLTIQKVADDGAILYTGPFRYQDYIERTSVSLIAVPDYRDGAPASARIDVRSVEDVNARVLALQAGDADIAQALLPPHVQQLESQGFNVVAFPFVRQNDVLLNPLRAPVDDIAVRRALSFAIDRDLLVSGVMDGIGEPAYGLAPTNIGLEGIIDTQAFDIDHAKTLLDDAGWVPGDGGIREKDGARLEFTLGYYQSRPELEGLGIAIQSQWRELGVEISLQLDPDINTTVANDEFTATLYSYGTAPNGDVDRALLNIYSPSSSNPGRYNNPEVNDAIERYRSLPEGEERLAALADAQRLIGDDLPVIYLINPYQIVGLAPHVTGFTPYPLENRKVDLALGIEG